MNIRDYIGIQYDIRNEHGVNCFGLYALVIANELGASAPVYSASNAKEAAIIFAAKLANGSHGMTETEAPKDYDFVLMNKGKRYHCGVLIGDHVLHAKGEGRRGSVCYDSLYDLKNSWNISYYETKCN